MRILIVGAGTVGHGLAEVLSEEQHEVWLIERQKKVATNIQHDNYSIISGDIFHLPTLEQTKIESIDVIIAVTENDATNIMICQLGKRYEVGIKIARIKNPDFASSKYPFSPEELGIDKVVNTNKLATETLDRLVKVASSSFIHTFRDSDVVLRGFYVPEDSNLANKTIADTFEGMADYSFLILAISRNQKMIVPKGDVTILPNDEIFVLMHKDTVEFFLPLIYKKVRPIRNVLIYGAHTISIGLAKSLSHSVNKVVLVDKDIANCELASQEALKCTVVCGDITNDDFQEELDLDSVDVFVAASPNDEQNFIASLMMKNKMPLKSRTLVISNKEEYDTLIPRVGLGEPINPRMIAIGEILSVLSNQNVLSIFKFNYGDDEVIDLKVSINSAVLKKPLKDIKLPKDSLVGCVIRDGEVTIPTGTTVFLPGDRVIIFALSHARVKAQSMFEPKKGWL